MTESAALLEKLKKCVEHETQAEQLHAYLLLLATWNKTYNLSGITSFDDMLSKHIADSLSIKNYITAQTILDVGTGAGLPGIPLAVIYPHKQFYLLDSNSKKIRFLIQAVHALQLKNVTIIHSRVENCIGQFEGIVSRAFSNLEQFIKLTEHLLSPQGCRLAMKAHCETAELSLLNRPYEKIPLSSIYPCGERNLIRIR